MRKAQLRSSGTSMGASTACSELRCSCALTPQIVMRPYDVAMFPYDVAMFLYNVAMFPYDVAMFLYDVATFLYDVATFLYNIAMYLHNVLMLRTEGLDRFRGLPLYARFSQSNRTQKRHRTTYPLPPSQLAHPHPFVDGRGRFEIFHFASSWD